MTIEQTLDPTELTCLQAGLKHLMDELERDPELYKSFRACSPLKPCALSSRRSTGTLSQGTG